MRWLSMTTVVLMACGPTPPERPQPDAGSIVELDAGQDAGLPDGGTPRCTITTETVTCSVQVTSLAAGTARRDVYWQTPSSPPPVAGYPVVVMYQGSLFPPETTWGAVSASVPFGGYYQAKLQAELLARGFTVIAPTAAVGLAWQTNSGLPWDATTDKPIIDALLGAMARGDFGPIDATRQYATGISSGGYMTSRMALSYPGVFRALAIASGSWATCAGALCVVPVTLPAGHPPTLFLHGRRDLTVPLFSAQAYETRLRDAGVETELLIDDRASHEWLPVAPERITAWFEVH